MGDSETKPSPKSDPDLSPEVSISPSPSDSAAAAASLAKKLGDLALADEPKPLGSGWPEEAAGTGEKPAEAAASVEEDEKGGGGVARPRFPRRPGEPDCAYYVKFGSCRFGMKCKFNHPPRKKKNKVKGSGNNNSNNNNKSSSPESEQASKEEHEGPVSERLVEAESIKFDDTGKSSPPESVKNTTYEKAVEVKKERMEHKEPKVIEDTEKGMPPKRAEETDQKAAKEKGKVAISEAAVQEECKYFTMPGGCKFGKACKYFHREGKEGKTEVDPVELNFLGLPLRPGGKECPYYMRTGSCKFSTNCKFHHPDPTAVGSRDQVSEHQNGDPQQHTASAPPQMHVPSWPDQRTLNEPVPFVAASPSYNAGIIPPQGIYPSPVWNGYQVPVNPYYPPGIPYQHFSAPPVNHAMYKAPDIPGPQQTHTDEYPERPGQPECQHFVKNGFCKFKMKCKYHHPKARLPSALTGGTLSPLGLPIKPDQPVCTYYGRYGVCKFGPACMYNHPFNYGPPVPSVGPPLSGQYPTPGNYAV